MCGTFTYSSPPDPAALPQWWGKVSPAHLRGSQTEVTVSLIAQRLVHVGGENPHEEHA